MDRLNDLLTRTAAAQSGRIAVRELDGSTLSYGELEAGSEEVADQIRRAGIGVGDRVGIRMRKSIAAVVRLFGILKSGAAYVPVDVFGPAARAEQILSDCGVSAVFLDDHPIEIRRGMASPLASELAYVLYTSGSTGKAKGVALTHANALSFIDWCSDMLAPRADDRFSSHAPFHFDLSILDVYVAIKHGAELVLFDEGTGKDPAALAAAIARERISIWYSVPAILALMAQYGKMERHEFGSLHTVLFAGEVFPIPRLRQLQQFWPRPRYLNLYGPTETNVCTYFELPREIATERDEPFPIGKPCAHARALVVDTDDNAVARGELGELCIAGPGVMQGYWNQPEATELAFLRRDGERWYRTGDIVGENEHGDYIFHGRRDRMVKRRGYRIELGEIEAGLHGHAGVAEAAAVARSNSTGDVQITAHLALRAGEGGSVLAFKRYCNDILPGYMVPDRFVFHAELPKTSTGKTDYQALQRE